MMWDRIGGGGVGGLTPTDAGGVCFRCAWGKTRLSQILSIQFKSGGKKAGEREHDGDPIVH